MNPIPAWVQRLWDAWDVRVLVLFSFTLQIILTILGSRRKYVGGIAGIVIRFIVWSAYLGADWVATLALGKLSEVETSSNNIVDPDVVLKALWVPLLLLHLGGPDTITAYSVEDGQLWLRHLLALVLQVVTVIYVILKCWSTKSWLIFLTFPIFFTGTIKYGERIWALKHSTEEIQYRPWDIEHKRYDLTVRLLLWGYSSLCQLNPVNEFCFTIKSYQDRVRLYLSNCGYGTEDVFKIVEFELGFMYDVLYTKAPIIYTTRGCCFRLISLVCIVSALVGFPFAAKQSLTHVDIAITYVLLIGAVVQEVYAVTLVIFSDWAIILMDRLERQKLLSEQVVRVVVPRLLSNQRRWSNYIGQFNLLSFSLGSDEQSKYSIFSRMINFFGMKEEFDKYWHSTSTDISKDLKELIILHIWSRLPAEKIEKQLELFTNKMGDLRVESLEFDHSITIWHMVTDICYYCDDDDGHGGNSTANSIQFQRDTSKQLSDYIMYLLLTHPYMLSTPLGTLTLYETSRGLKSSLSKDAKPSSIKEACDKLLALPGPDDYYMDEARNQRLSDMDIGQYIPWKAQELARSLMYKKAGKWEVISRMWVQILCYAASRCPVSTHVTQLRRGGEFFTHVWLLQEHTKRGSFFR